MALEVLSGGHSNVTCAATVGDPEVVVRMPPPWLRLPTANDVGREHWLHVALQGTRVPTPQGPRLVPGPGGLGGAVLRDGAPARRRAPRGSVLAGLMAAAGRRVSEASRRRPRRDPRHRPPRGGARRRGPSRRLPSSARSRGGRSSGTGPPTTRTPLSTSSAARPGRGDLAPPPATIVHGDYRLGNPAMFDAATRTEVIGVLDWGDGHRRRPPRGRGLHAPLPWAPPTARPSTPARACADLPGFLSGDELIDRYARVT